jgi:hypothetical protein
MRTNLHHGLERERVEDRAHEPGRFTIVECQAGGNGWSTEIAVDEKNPRIGSLGERSREVDGSCRFPVADRRAQDGDDGEIGRPVELFHTVPKNQILFRFERARGKETDQMFVKRSRICRAR